MGKYAKHCKYIFQRFRFIKLFNEFTYQGMEINLFPETTITKEEALIKYKEAYNYIAEKASALGIVADLDNYEFQQYIKGYAIPTSTNKELNDKLAEFAEFIDIYENAESNKKIISCLKEKEFNSEELELLLPISKSSTELSNKITPSDNRESKESTFVYELEPGEGAENGIASSKEGAVILTNQNCYLLNAKDGVQVQWCTPYESVGAKDSKEGDETTGGGLAWGGGCSPSLTSKLVMFTDNQDPVNLLALDMKTGEIVASMPVIDELPKNMQVSVENSAMVYDNGEGTVSTIVCNWFGAGSAKLADADNDSSIQTYENIYDVNWLKKGNKMVVPGVERVDTIKTKDGYEMKSIWCRNDIRDTSMMKLSTATGYIYGYVQDLESGMWQFIMLDFETGETVFTMDVSDKPGYNNMAIGMYAGNSGNTLYCPTGYLELLRLQDRFVYLPEMPYRKVDLDKAKRNVLTQEEFTEAGGKGNVAGWLNTITVENVHPNTTVAIRMKGIAGKADTFTLYAYDKENKLKEVPAELWHIQEEDGTLPDKLTEDTLYEVHVMVEDGGEFDLSDTEKEIKIAVILGNK